MEPFSFDSDDSFGNRVIPTVAFSDNSIDAYLESLDNGTKEAVERNRDQFKTRDDVERFIQGLRG